MQCLMVEHPVEKVPLTATVRVDGYEVVVRITNHDRQPVFVGYVQLAQDRFFDFIGPVPPGETKEFREVRAGGGENDKVWFDAMGIGPRTAAIDALLARGAAMVCARYEHADPPCTLRGRTCQGKHVQIVRLVVWPTKG